jgi:hypothetical protein
MKIDIRTKLIDICRRIKTKGQGDGCLDREDCDQVKATVEVRHNNDDAY